jgi:hypothetical protein
VFEILLSRAMARRRARLGFGWKRESSGSSGRGRARPFNREHREPGKNRLVSLEMDDLNAYRGKGAPPSPLWRT